MITSICIAFTVGLVAGWKLYKWNSYQQSMEPLCTVTIVVYEGHCSTNVVCGPGRKFEEVLTELHLAKGAIDTQIDLLNGLVHSMTNAKEAK